MRIKKFSQLKKDALKIPTFKALALFILLLSQFISKAQQKGCKDSIQQYSYSYESSNASYDLIMPLQDLSKNIIFPITNDNTNKWSLTKTTNGNRFIWCKKFPLNYSSANLGIGSTSINDSNDIIVLGTYYGLRTNRSIGDACMLKFDSNAAMQYKKIYTPTTPADNSITMPALLNGLNNDIISLNLLLANSGLVNIALLDNNGNIKWSKSYNTSSTSPPHHNSFLAFSGKEIIVVSYLYDNSTTEHFFIITKINYTDGSIIQSVSYTFTNTNNTSLNFSIYGINFHQHSQELIIDAGYLAAPSQLGHIVSIFDTSLTQLKAIKLVATTAYTENQNPEKVFISTNNDIFYTKPSYGIPLYSDTSLQYVRLNRNIDIIEQQSIDLFNYPLSNPGNFQANAFLKAQDVLCLQLYCLGSGANNVLMMDNIPFYDKKNSCFGKENTVYSKAPVIVKKLDYKIDLVQDQPLNVTDLQTDVGIDNPVPTIEICKEVSICDTIKINGPQSFCFPDTLHRYTVYRNPLCKRKIIVTGDSNFVSSVIKINDSTYDVTFKKAGLTYLYASFDGCSLKDSLQVNIINPKSNFSINKDSLLCPGKNFTLQASNGFAFYQWQDSSNIDNYHVTDTGFYKVSAIDSCGNIFSDSIYIQFADTSLPVPPSALICNTDSFKLQVPSYFTNVTLQPSFSASYSKNQIAFYPSQTTTYTIKAEAKDGCEIQKNILINVDNCEANIFFPNAFTPNDKASNNFFKPFVTLPLQLYQLVIFNKYGQKIFESNNPSIGWDGKFNERPQDTGTYTYYCNYKFFSKPAKTKKGFCVLLR